MRRAGRGRPKEARRPDHLLMLAIRSILLLPLATAASEAASIDRLGLLAEQVTADVLVAEDAGRIALLDQVDKVGEARVELPELDRCQVVRLGPVRPAGVRANDRDEARKVAPVRRREAVRTKKGTKRSADSPRKAIRVEPGALTGTGRCQCRRSGGQSSG